MHIFVTGGTGFIGKNLVEELVKQDHDVTCLVRKKNSFLDSLHIEQIVGCLSDFDTDLSRFDVIIHLAGIMGGPFVKDEEYDSVIVKGTQDLIDRCSGQKFIHCSSAGVHGPVILADEEYGLNPTNAYELAKSKTELVVKKYDNHVILRPEFVYGPHDMHVLRLFLAIKRGRFYTLGDGNSMLHPTYIDDLIYCLIRCLDENIRNETFIIAGDKPVEINDFVQIFSELMDVEVNKMKIPIQIAKIYAWVARPLIKFGIDPIVTDTRIDFFTKSRTFNTMKAQNMLGYRPVKIEEGLNRTIKWYEDNGYLN